MYKPSNNHFAKLPHPLGYYWNTVIPSTLSDALSYDEMFAKLLYTVNQIIENQYLTVPYLISTNFQYTTESITIRGILYQDYTAIECNQEFTINGMADGTYYINVFNDSLNKAVGVPKETSDTLYLSTEYMPMNSTTLYIFNVVGGKIDGDSIKYNDLYCHMHNIDPEAHKELFDAVNARIDKEIQDRTEADSTLQDNIDAEEAARIAADNTLQSNIDTEESERKQADTQLQNNIDAETSAREEADTAINTAIKAEETARKQADTTLQANIDAEIENRQDEDTALHEAIASEASTRQTEDEALAGQITTETEQRQQQDTALNNTINGHIKNKNNPHSVTKAQVGLGNVANTAQISSINGVTPTVAGDVGIESSDGSITITENNHIIDIKAVGGGGGVAGVSSFAGLTGDITISSGTGLEWHTSTNSISTEYICSYYNQDLNPNMPQNRAYKLKNTETYTNIPDGEPATGWTFLVHANTDSEPTKRNILLIGEHGVFLAQDVQKNSDISGSWVKLSGGTSGVTSLNNQTGAISIGSNLSRITASNGNISFFEYNYFQGNDILNSEQPNRFYLLGSNSIYTNAPVATTGWKYMLKTTGITDTSKHLILIVGNAGAFTTNEFADGEVPTWTPIAGGGVTALTVNDSPRTGNIKVTGNTGIGVAFTEPDNRLTLSNTGVTAVNNKTGNVNITTGTGILTTPVEDGLLLSNNGVTSLLVNDDSLATAVYVKGHGGVSVGTSASTGSGRTDTLNITGQIVNEFTNIQLINYPEIPAVTLPQSQIFRAFTEDDTRGLFSFAMYSGTTEGTIAYNTLIYKLPGGWYFKNKTNIPVIIKESNGNIICTYLTVNDDRDALGIMSGLLTPENTMFIPQFTIEIYKGE